jgi:hypothetical protein
MARERLVIDRFLNDPMHLFWVHPKTIQHLRNVARKAHRFVFDDTAIARVGEILHDIPELIVREHQFARAPYDLTWIEFPLAPLFESVTGESFEGGADNRVGYLIDHGTAYIFACGPMDDPDQKLAVVPLVYDLHTPWPIPEQEALARHLGGTRERLMEHAWGVTFAKLQPRDQGAAVDNNTMRLLPLAGGQVDTQGYYRSAFATTVSDLRNIVTLLLMLNRPQVTRYETVERSRGFVRGKLRQYLSHTLVRIDVDPKPVMLRLGTPAGEAVARRRHEVRGHWRHDRAYHAATKAGCIHAWKQHPRWQDDEHWLCQTCQGERWWINHHVRGSALTGFVIKDGYEVSAAGAEPSANSPLIGCGSDDRLRSVPTRHDKD